MALEIIIAVLLLILAYIIFIYNNLIALKERHRNALSQIDVQLKRRADLIPNLIETVKGYMAHEKTLLKEIAKLRSSILTGNLEQRLDADKKLHDNLKTIFAIAENYPQLRANENFMQLQEELVTTENRIAYARQVLNDVVYIFNARIKQFPTNIIARLFNFTELSYFEAEEKEKQSIKINMK
ncbi:MAG: LemA family protein [Candidatus Anstonellales archaeon]